VTEITADSRSPYRLYRWFDDEQVVLYIGRSSQLAIREHVHIESARWMDFAASSTVQRYETLDDLMDAEREAIKTERPIFNKQHNDTPEAKQRLRSYLEQAGRLDLLEPGPKMIARPAQGNGVTALPELSPEDEARKAAWEAGESVELFPGGPWRMKRTATNAHQFNTL